ncbi:efflux RND transporter periplasmic adaptor subunit [Halodurantibacterium flavum]|uniref:Efflux RND transporter periplasmic adaptor subunit n=1 Tax=Halodurantibacterium flavum TaxID=1382802 RepID=A0ABW4S464_9RHOB
MSRSSIAIAGILALGAAGWMASGILFGEPSAAVAPQQAQTRVPLVEVATLRAQEVPLFVSGQGDVMAFRTAPARSQSAGRVAEILVDRGERVEAGQPVFRMTLEGLDSRLREAEAVLDRRQRDYDAQLRLQQSGYSTAAQLRELETLLQSAREEVARLEEQIDDTLVRAPFPGQVDDIAAEVGEYVGAGTDVITIVENAPLRTIVRVSQMDRARIQSGRVAEVRYATGQTERGLVCFVAAAADSATRTFAVEVRTANAEGEIPSGISAEVVIPTETVSAHFVSPAILSLGTSGELGVKTADAAGIVAFHQVEIVRAEAAGLWVSGLPEAARVITIGQGFVQDGDRVRLSEAGSASGVPVPRSGLDETGLPESLCARAPGLSADTQSAGAGQ